MRLTLTRVFFCPLLHYRIVVFLLLLFYEGAAASTSPGRCLLRWGVPAG